MNGQIHQEKMFLLIREWQNGGLTQNAFFKEKRINFNKFQYWLKKFRSLDKKESPAFIPVRIEPPVEEALNLEIVYPNGVVLKVPFRTDLNQIRNLVNLV